MCYWIYKCELTETSLNEVFPSNWPSLYGMEDDPFHALSKVALIKSNYLLSNNFLSSNNHAVKEARFKMEVKNAQLIVEEEREEFLEDIEEGVIWMR